MKSQKLKKIDIVNLINENNNISVEKQQIQSVIDSFLEQIKNALINGNSIELRGFGTFEPKLKNEKKVARNLVTGEVVTVKPHFAAAFKPGKELKEEMKKLEIYDNEKK